jgi:hypothetical protein
MLEWLERRFKSAYLKRVEDDNKTLREELFQVRGELRQLMNSILASHGMPQIDGPRTNITVPVILRRDWTSFMRRKEAESRKPPAVAMDIAHA